jgi:WD40 repeat protein
MPSLATETGSVRGNACSVSRAGGLRHRRAYRFALASAGVISVGINGELAMWDAERRVQLARTQTSPVDAWCLAHSPIVPQFAAAGQGRVSIWTWDADAMKKVATVAAPTSWCTGVAYSPDGLRVAVCGHDGRAHVIDCETATVTSSFSAHELPGRAISFSCDGAQLFTAGDDQRIAVWDVSGGGSAASASPLIGSMSGHVGSVTAIAGSSEKPVVASASADATVRIWDARKREQVHAFYGKGDRLHAVAWSVDGARVASASDTGTVGIFLVASVM